VLFWAETAHTCKALGVLPRAGGLFDQDAEDVFRIQCVLAADAEREHLERERQKH
jgi:hypothetical protein